MCLLLFKDNTDRLSLINLNVFNVGIASQIKWQIYTYLPEKGEL
jgi:hypothetical protein